MSSVFGRGSDLQSLNINYTVRNAVLALQGTAVTFASLVPGELLVPSPGALGQARYQPFCPQNLPAPVLLTKVFLDRRPGVSGMARRSLQHFQR